MNYMDLPNSMIVFAIQLQENNCKKQQFIPLYNKSPKF
jgi:hypothetical protein